MSQLVFAQSQSDATLHTTRVRPTKAAPAPAAGVQRFDVQWARELCEVREAQRLRYAVFAG